MDTGVTILNGLVELGFTPFNLWLMLLVLVLMKKVGVDWRFWKVNGKKQLSTVSSDEPLWTKFFDVAERLTKHMETEEEEMRDFNKRLRKVEQDTAFIRGQLEVK